MQVPIGLEKLLFLAGRDATVRVALQDHRDDADWLAKHGVGERGQRMLASMPPATLEAMVDAVGRQPVERRGFLAAVAGVALGSVVGIPSLARAGDPPPQGSAPNGDTVAPPPDDPTADPTTGQADGAKGILGKETTGKEATLGLEAKGTMGTGISPKGGLDVKLHLLSVEPAAVKLLVKKHLVNNHQLMASCGPYAAPVEAPEGWQEIVEVTCTFANKTKVEDVIIDAPPDTTIDTKCIVSKLRMLLFKLVKKHDEVSYPLTITVRYLFHPQGTAAKWPKAAQ